MLKISVTFNSRIFEKNQSIGINKLHLLQSKSSKKPQNLIL